jgi:two-component system chemotaxis response regulator CheB
MGAVLSGWGSDGTAGLQEIVKHGGIGLVQDPDEAASPMMPRSAVTVVPPDACLPLAEIVPRVRAFCAGVRRLAPR